MRADVFPIGIDAERFAELCHRRSRRAPRLAQIRSRLHGRKQIIGVDRLDYSKGIPERLQGVRAAARTSIRSIAAR